jgi:hypothetical protein
MNMKTFIKVANRRRMTVVDRKHLLRAPFPSPPGLGQPPAAVLQCETFVKPLTRFSHFHINKVASPGRWLVSSAPVPMIPPSMNPGFIDTTAGTLLVSSALDQRLKSLVADLQANRPPFNKEPYKKFVRSGSKIRIALVDMSSTNKLLSPQLAEFNSTIGTKAASLAKIGALYAAHQLRFDLNQKGKNPAGFSSSEIIQLQKIFDVTRVGVSAPAVTFDFNAFFLGKLNDLCHNCSASFVIGHLGTTYITSVLKQSGLYDCRLAGLWVGTTYANQQEIRDDCPPVGLLNSRLAHRADPINSLFHSVTALSAASFFTLLAQGRLVDDSACQSIKDKLLQQKSGCPSRFEDGLNAAGLPVNSDRVFSKIGVLPSKVDCANPGPGFTCFIHEAALIERAHGTKQLRYAVSVITESRPGGGANDLLIDIIAKLDELVRTNP